MWLVKDAAGKPIAIISGDEAVAKANTPNGCSYAKHKGGEGTSAQQLMALRNGARKAALDEVRLKAARDLGAHSAAHMRLGVTSSALGAPHTYGNAETDQINRLTAALAGQGASITCADASGNWQPRPHTADQLRQVIADGAAWVDACRAQRKALEAKLAAVKTAEEAAALKWVRPE